MDSEAPTPCHVLASLPLDAFLGGILGAAPCPLRNVGGQLCNSCLHRCIRKRSNSEIAKAIKCPCLRIPALRYPFKLFTLGVVAPRTFCKQRQDTAAELLDAIQLGYRGTLDQTTRKFTDFFAPELRQAAADGTCAPKLWAAMVALRRLWRSDTRENERINKMIGIQGDRSPNISLELLSSRIALKHYFGAALSTHEQNRGRETWSTSRPIAAALLHTCLGNAPGAVGVMENEERWSAPLPWVPPPPAMALEDYEGAEAVLEAVQAKPPPPC